MSGDDLEFYDGMIARLIEEGQSGKNIAVKQEDISRILLKAKEIFLSQPSMLELASPIKILGDIHGCVLFSSKNPPPRPRRAASSAAPARPANAEKAVPSSSAHFSVGGAAGLKRCPSRRARGG